MRILVCGGRDFSDFELLDKVLMSFENCAMGPISAIIHGDARGADSIAGAWARVNNKEEIPFPANWEKHGKAAGPIRNAEMLLQTRPCCVVAFPGGIGTSDMIKRSKKAGYRVFIITPDWQLTSL